MKTREYTHYLNKNMISILRKMPEHREFIMSKIGLNHVEIANAHKLRYWGLIEKTSNHYWQVTGHGCKFLVGVESVPEKVHTLNGHFNRFSGKHIYIHDIIDMPYRTRRDYAVDTPERVTGQGSFQF